MRRSQRSRDIRRSCIEISHRSLVKRSCRELVSSQEVQGYPEILYRDISYGGPVKRSCRERELLYRDLS